MSGLNAAAQGFGGVVGRIRRAGTALNVATNADARRNPTPRLADYLDGVCRITLR